MQNICFSTFCIKPQFLQSRHPILLVVILGEGRNGSVQSGSVYRQLRFGRGAHTGDNRQELVVSQRGLAAVPVDYVLQMVEGMGHPLDYGYSQLLT